jgi:peptidoglycan/LPS O-acetylase OafA/YrhL
MATGLTSLGFGFEAVAAGGTRNGMPAFPFFMFGLVGVIGCAGDMRILRSGALNGASRLARHLWRMCFALFIAALSFFIGQSDEFPQTLRIMPLLALPVLTVLVSMFYWLWRVRIRQSLRGLTMRDETGRAQPVPLPLTASASRP